LAYTIRKSFVGWRIWVIPLTVTYACMPILLWYEHELLAEAIFFQGVVWMCAGWMAFSSQTTPERARSMWWWFYAGLAAVVLTKPAGRFFWPVILFALICIGAWRVLNRKHWIAFAGLFGLTLTMGQDAQSSWLLYTSAFPLTRLDTPLHAEYKAEITDMVRDAQQMFARGEAHKDRT